MKKMTSLPAATDPVALYTTSREQTQVRYIFRLANLLTRRAAIVALTSSQQVLETLSLPWKLGSV